MSITPEKFVQILLDKNIRFFTGVPDSLLKSLSAYIDKNISHDNHIIAANEGNAIAIAAGSYLATGHIPLVYMQNSGLGNAVNPLLSLCDREIYSIPMLLVIGWRGAPGMPDAVQHAKDGRIQLDFLRTMELPYEILSNEDPHIDVKVRKSIEMAEKQNQPSVLLIKKGTFEDYQSSQLPIDEGLMLRIEALDIILEDIEKNSVVVSTTGKTSRELFELREKNGQQHFSDFLMIGSMGHGSSIALGIAVSKPERDVYFIDGDGALIMHMGSLSTIGKQRPKNFKHILINNKVHESVGAQETAATNIDIPGIAKANGYRNVYSVQSKKMLCEIFRLFMEQDGPSLLEINVRPGSQKDLGRPTTPLVESKLSFMNFLSQQ